MKVSEFIRRFGHLKDYEMVLSKHFVIDEEHEYKGILDCPVQWIATNDDDKEIRFVINEDTMKFLGKEISEL